MKYKLSGSVCVYCKKNLWLYFVLEIRRLQIESFYLYKKNT